MQRTLILIAALGAAAACSSDRTYEAGGDVDSLADTTTHVRVPDIDVGMTRDTVTVPTFGTVTDTVIIDKPVVTGKKQVEVKRPTVDVNRKP